MRIPNWLYWDRRALGWYVLGGGIGFGFGVFVGMLLHG